VSSVDTRRIAWSFLSQTPVNQAPRLNGGAGSRVRSRRRGATSTVTPGGAQDIRLTARSPGSHYSSGGVLPPPAPARSRSVGAARGLSITASTSHR
jgi:hypothetical protein